MVYLKKFFVNFLIVIIFTIGCSTDNSSPDGVGNAAPILNNLSLLSFDSTSITLNQPTFSTAGNPAPTVQAYIGLDGTISISDSTVSDYTQGPVNVASGDYQFQNLNANTTYRIIVVAQNSEGYSVKEITQITDDIDCTEAQPIQVLFIGNSYTSSNSLPSLVSQYSCGLGDNIEYDSSTPGGYWFSDHKDNSDTLAKINSTNWDFVVLQNQSQVPGWKPTDVTANSLPNAQELVDVILANNAATTVIYFQTWGRQNGDSQNCSYYPLVCTFDGHTQALIEGYDIYANNTGGEIAPVGAAWKLVVDDNNAPFSADDLWSGDGSHPELHGSYLAAAVIYGTISSSSITGNSYTAGLSDVDAIYLQQQAEAVISQL